MIENRQQCFTLSVVVFCIAIASSTFAHADGAVKPVPIAVAPLDEARYKTYLFNLLIDQKSLIDGKNHYDPDFARRFDALLVNSVLAKTAAPGVALKKRLLSGPAPEPVVLQDASSLRRYVGYAACQAHACSDTHLRLLYAPASKAMVGRLALAGKVEFLGKPSPAERALLEQAQATP